MESGRTSPIPTIKNIPRTPKSPTNLHEVSGDIAETKLVTGNSRGKGWTAALRDEWVELTEESAQTLDSLTSENERLRSEGLRVEEQRNNYRTRLDLALEQVRKAKEKEDKMPELIKELEQYKMKISVRDAMIAANQQTIEKLTKNLKLSEELLRNKEQELAEAQDQLEQAENEVEEKENQLQLKETEIQERDAALDPLLIYFAKRGRELFAKEEPREVKDEIPV
eukprot:TRINITY_DN2735_c0_g1_i1.p1 TRINITY_DN2735_c0_g1~~TRINITY_DN2735_c0_g1_i1.p1  ORF type:complete len:225 (-),score=81.01 TRINITY_DN2735_c0_g1_i1:64-738(-)